MLVAPRLENRQGSFYWSEEEVVVLMQLWDQIRFFFFYCQTDINRTVKTIKTILKGMCVIISTTN